MIIEVDGAGHAERDQIVADDVRTRFLESQGYRVLRFWNNDVLKDTEAVMVLIYDALNGAAGAAAPTPDPSPPRARVRGGRGTQS